MKAIRFVFAALALLTAGVTSAYAHDSVGFSLNIGVPGYYVAPPPVYYVPPVVTYYQPAPVYYYETRSYYPYYSPNVSFYYRGGDRGWHGDHGWGHGHGWGR